MRRRLLILMSLLGLSSAASASLLAGPSFGQAMPEDPARGVVFDGLRPSPLNGPCRGTFELPVRSSRPATAKVPCTHGPDPAPPGVDVRVRREPELQLPGADSPLSGEAAAASAGIPCYENGSDGYRVQVIYARASNVADRYADYAASFVQWTAAVDNVVRTSAQETNGTRHVRFVTDANCNLIVTRVTLTATGDDNFDNTVAELHSQGFSRTDRKYLVYVDANVYCGIGEYYHDDSFDTTPGSNANNGHPQAPGTVARVDNACWGRANSVEAHELMHGLGGVQNSAPHSTGRGHCTDDYDRMCYVDAAGLPVSNECPATSHENVFDCNHDDYFSTNAPASSYLSSHWNTASSAFLARSAPDSGIPPATAGRFTPLTPARILDTRNGTGGISGAVGPGATVDVQITGQGGVPASGVAAVAMNVTVTQPTATGWLTLYPTGTTRPVAANLNFTPNKTVPNLVVVKVGSGGKVSLYNSSGSTHVIFDVAGWYGEVPTGNDGRFQSLVPARILDTRNGTGGGVRLGPGASLDMQVSGQGGVPATGAGAAVLNVAVTGTTATSFLTVYPTGEPRPNAANLNYTAGDTVSNRVMAKLGTGGKLTIYNNAGSADVIVDVNGWYTDPSVAGTSGTYNALVPARILDTRDGTGGVSGARPAGSIVDVQVTGQGGVPASGVSAVILNATVTQPAAGGYLTIFPAGTAQPVASDLNYASGETRPNLVVVKVGANGRVSLFTSASTHVIWDVAGWFG